MFILTQGRKSSIFERNIWGILQRIVTALKRIEFVNDRIRLLFIHKSRALILS